MAPGRKTGGRQPGSRNKKTLAQKEAALAALAKLTDKIPDAFQGDSVVYLISLYCDPQQPLPVRLDAAKAAARFERPQLAQVDQAVLHGISYVVQVPQKFDTVEAWEAIFLEPANGETPAPDGPPPLQLVKGNGKA